MGFLICEFLEKKKKRIFAQRDIVWFFSRLYFSGVNMSIANYDGRTALHLAASEGHSSCVKFLVEVCHLSPLAKDRYANKRPYIHSKFIQNCYVFQQVGILSFGWSRTIPTRFCLPIFGKTRGRQFSWGLGRTAQKGRQKIKLLEKEILHYFEKRNSAFISSIPLKKKTSKKKS